MLRTYFKALYERTMRKAYELAFREISAAMQEGGLCLDCGANRGHWYEKLSHTIGLTKDQYYGIEWNEECARSSQLRGLNIKQGDLNKGIPYKDGTFTCIYALSVLEHLLNGCFFMRECYRALKRDGKLVLLTPNISTYFTAMLILAGRMPSSGPHPDSNILLKEAEIFKVKSSSTSWDIESDFPLHRHLVVFSYRSLKMYLQMIGFSQVKGYGFGLYPLPNFLQPIAEKIDPYHCHQMVFVVSK